MVKGYKHTKRGSDDDTVALTAIDTEQQRAPENSEPEYEYKNVKWKDLITKKKYIRMCAVVVAWRGTFYWSLYSMVDFGDRGCGIGWIDVILSW